MAGKSEPMLLPNGDLVVPEVASEGSFSTTSTRVIKPDDPTYPQHYAAYKEREKSAGGLGVLGGICALLLPPIGLIIGIVLMAQKRTAALPS